MTWTISGINHVGLAPKDAAKARWFFRSVLGLDFLGDEVVASQQTLTGMFRHHGSGSEINEAADDTPTRVDNAGQRLEILTPAPEGQGPIAKFLEKKGSGIHHIALTVNHLTDLLAHLKSQGVRLIDEVPRPGAHNTLIAFVHPESTGGLLVEFVQESLVRPTFKP